jgi:succinoglycan biosynthesis transport protein ExoP
MDMRSRRTGIDYTHGGGAEDAAAVASMSALIEQLTGFVRRRYRVLVVVVAAAIALGLLYLIVTPPQYTATATLLIDTSMLRALQNQQQQQVGDTPLDAAQVGSQVEILLSQKIALAVIRELNLIENPEFVKTGAGAFGGIWRLFSPSPPDAGSTADKERRALNVFLSHRSITRVERTYALEIAYTSLSPVVAAKVANSIADAYIDDQLEAKYQITRRASAWLQDRINELKAQATSADRAVLAFKEKNNIVDFGGTSGTANAGASSRLIGEQQLFDLNSQLGAARVATSEAKTRLERIEEVRKLDVGEAAVADTLRNEVITRLRNQYLDLSAREANWSSRYGQDHLAAQNLRDQMEQLRRNISAELARIAASYQSDFEIAKAREENLDRALASLISEGQVTNRDRLGLTELESSAKSYHTIYDNFLQRYMEAIQQQSFPITDARVISSAAPPSKKSKPADSLILAIAATMGIIFGLGIATLREAIDGVFRTSRHTEQALRAKCLSVIPLLTKHAVSAPAAEHPVARRTRPSAGAWRGPNGQTDESAMPDATCFAFASPLMQHVVDEPWSVFTEAFRAIKVAAELRAATQDHKVIGITSTLPNEGKSTIACNLAALMADAGKRVILMDMDLRNPTLVTSLTPRPTVGLMELLTGKIDLQQAIGRERATGLTFLPLVLNEQIAHSDEVLSSQAFRSLVDQLRQSYDFVIMDLPPIAPVVDVRATIPVIDSLVFVVEWGNTKINAVQHHLMAEPELHDRLLGVVLNKANLKMLERFDRHSRHQNGYYENYNYRQSAR